MLEAGILRLTYSCLPPLTRSLGVVCSISLPVGLNSKGTLRHLLEPFFFPASRIGEKQCGGGAGWSWLPANPQKSWRGKGVSVAQRLPGAAGHGCVCTRLCGVCVGMGLGL